MNQCARKNLAKIQKMSWNIILEMQKKIIKQQLALYNKKNNKY